MTRAKFPPEAFVLADKMDGALYEGCGVCSDLATRGSEYLPMVFLHEADGFAPGTVFDCEAKLLRPLTPAAREMLAIAKGRR